MNSLDIFYSAISHPSKRLVLVDKLIPFYNPGKPGRQGVLAFVFSIDALPFGDKPVQDGGQCFGCRVFFGIQVKMQHWIGEPFLFQLVDGQSFEEFTLSFEIAFHHGNEQALAKSARTTEEIELSSLDEFVEQGRLVRIIIVILTDGFEVLYANWVSHTQ